MRSLVICFICLLWVARTTNAGVFTPDHPSPFTLNTDGSLRELIYIPVFKSLLDERFNALNPAAPLAYDGQPSLRGQLLNQIKPLSKSATEAELIAWSSQALRLGQFAEVVNVLQPFARSRQPNYVLLVHLAHAHASRGDFDEAIRAHTTALFDADPPEVLPGHTPETTKIILKVQKDYYAKRLRQRRNEALQRLAADRQQVPELFGTADAPVRWVNDAGVYEPGNLAPSEQAKLPRDAVAIVQQLLLWSPEDTPLLWLLAELYAADGRFREAEQVFDQLTWGRNFTNRKLLMEHRAAVRQAEQNLPPESNEFILLDEPRADATPNTTEQEEAKWQELRRQLIPVIIILALLSIGGVALFVRSLLRTARRRN